MKWRRSQWLKGGMGSSAFTVGGAQWCKSELTRQIAMMEPMKHEALVGAVLTASWRRWFLVAWSQYGHWRLSLTFKLLCFWSSGWWACVGHLFFFFFFFCVLWVMGSMIRCGHRWWSLAWEASLASLLAWGWKTHVGLGGIYWLQGLVWACSRSHGANTWKVLSYLASLLFWWFLLSSGCLRLCCMD